MYPLLAKSCVLLVFCVFDSNSLTMAATGAGAIQCEHATDGGIQWLRVKPWMVDVLHRTKRPTSYRCIAMAIKFAIDLPEFFVAVDSLSPTTIAK
jgi:hypothetical protein